MPSIKVNGVTHQIDTDKTLLRFLRDDLNLMGTKDGCSEGACGACTVLIDGKKTKACLQKLSRLDGKSIITIEGLTEWEKKVFSFCFAEAGAVQCGFCIPGMVLCAKALLDQNPNPTDGDIKAALLGNICRCTGYVKIEKAIKMAAGYYQSGNLPELEVPDGLLGHHIQRLDAAAKILGTGIYTDDIVLPGMVHCVVLRAPVPRCRIIRIDTSEAERDPDCIRILTASDVPYNFHGHLVPDWDVLIPEGECTRYIGDALALVAAPSVEAARKVMKLIHVEYEELECIDTWKRALEEDAPKLHEKGNLLARIKLSRGDAHEALINSAHVVHRSFYTPRTEHAFMEPECAVATCSEDNHVIVHSSGQSVFDEQREISRMLELPKENVRVISALVGGGFGGKEDMSVQHHAALMAWALKRPVKLRLTRQESINVHPKRHAFEMEMFLGCDETGHLTALSATLITDNGAYASLGHPVLERACTHAAGPYNYQNIDILGMAVYTDNVPCGAYRGFGVTQSCFALESCLNIMAEEIGMDPFQIRLLNAVKPGDVLPNGQVAGPDTALTACLEAARNAYYSDPMAGIACSMKNTGVGVGVTDTGRCRIKVQEDGKVHVYCSAACMGQGFATVALQIAAQTTGLSPDLFEIAHPDTSLTPDCGTSTASRQTAITGEAVRRSSLKLAEALEGRSLEELAGQEFYGEFSVVTDPVGSSKPNPVSHLAYSYSVQVASLSEDLRVRKITAVCDSGTVINPRAIEGQVEGGVLMGMGYALTENFPVDKGIPKVRYGTLGLLKAKDVPEIVPEFVCSPTPLATSYGAKGIGELASIGTAPAIWHAYYRHDKQERNTLPMSDTPYSRK